MTEQYKPITETSRLRCSHAELRYWERQGVDMELLFPAIGQAVIRQELRIDPVPEPQLIS